MKLIARKSFLYNTRRLLAGDEFEPVKPIHGKLLIAAKKAREKRETGKLSAPPLIVTDKVAKASRKHKVDPTEQPAAVPLDPDGNPGSDTVPSGAEPIDELAVARADYQEAIGKKPYHGWSVDELRAKIAAGADADDGADDEPVAAVSEPDADDAAS